MRLKSRKNVQIEKTYLEYELYDEFWLTEPDDDADKMEYVQFLLNQRYADERKIADSMKNRTIFFLGIIGVSLTLLLTTLSDKLTSFGSWEDFEQIWFYLVCSVLALSVICYIRIFYTLNSMDYSERYPVNENAPYLLQKNSLKLTELQHFQNFRMYLRIRWFKQENIKIQHRFKWGDIFYFVALLFCFIGAIVFVPFSPVAVASFVLLFMFGCYILLSSLMLYNLTRSIIRDLHKIITHVMKKKKTKG